jgi:hypothetical protein
LQRASEDAKCIRIQKQLMEQIVFSHNVCSLLIARSMSHIQLLQASSHMKSCIEDEVLEDFHLEDEGGNHGSFLPLQHISTTSIAKKNPCVNHRLCVISQNEPYWLHLSKKRALIPLK